MRIIVCVAAVPNPANVKWDRFRNALDVQDAEPVLNPVDRHALELAAGLAKQTSSTFDAVCAGVGATAALREAAVFGADRLVAVADEALESADEAGIAAALSAAVSGIGGADVVFCGASTASYGSGAVPGYVSAHVGAGLLVDALAMELAEDELEVTVLSQERLCALRSTLPVVVTAAPFGIKVRAVSPLLLIKASKKSITSMTLGEIGCGLPLPTTGAIDGALESARARKGVDIVDGPDAGSRAIALVAALRDKQAV